MSSSLVKPNSFHNKCIKIVSKFVECHDPLRFELVDAAKGVFSLRNSNNVIIKKAQPRFYLLKVKKNTGLYLHVSVTLKAPFIRASLEKSHEFEGISIQFLQGTGKLFCRAEWDVKKNRDKLEHPQPHWHWGYDKVTIYSQGFEDNLAVVAQGYDFMQELAENDSTIPLIDFEDLHYAMAAKWTIQDSALEDFDIHRLYKWLENCITNVIDQYNYQVNKGSFESSKGW